ncbi:MAG: T9SS type A sorting domain-containing protein [Ignavibacteriaceae bacterium]|nr:T9SS type A sorting domain-containing protein [Ignavibacteriaceae bacterium]
MPELSKSIQSNNKNRFQSAIDSKVTLSIFNILGEKVATILNNNMSAGNHSIDFNAAELNSGVYFYKIEAIGNNGINFSSTKKMIVIK